MRSQAIPILFLAVAALAGGDRLSADDEQSRATRWAIQGSAASREGGAPPMAAANAEVMAIAKDTLAAPARLAHKSSQAEVWVKPIGNGAMAVAVFNRGKRAAQVDVIWKELGLSGSPRVRDLWKRQDRGKVHGGFAEKLPAGGAALFRVVP